MQSLFDETSYNEIISRINKLTPESTREWGKMNVTQMLAHLSQAFRTASGELRLKPVLIGKIFGSWAKKKYILSDGELSKNSPTDKSFIIKGEPDFETEKKTLIALIKKFSEGGINGVSDDAHPFFGKLTPNEWDRLMYKHIDHHLRQFGV